MNNSATPTFYWYDYEAFGLNPMSDRLAQFAGIRTDMDLNIIGEPVMMYCKPANDFLPNPSSCLITGITPQKALAEGLPEAEFIQRINQEFSQANTCVLGYNNLRFDDEFTRHTLYRNLFDPYAREWQNGCSRWDLLDLVRATRSLRPEGIEWPVNDEGRPSVRLEDLTVANGISHESAHDALSDVYATIAVAKLIKQQQPKLFDFAFNNRSKNKLFKLLNLREQKPVIHVSGMYPVEKGNMAVVVPVAQHPINKNGIIVYDLSADPQDLLNLSPAKIHERLFTRNEDLAEGVARIPLKTVHVNKCPVIAPFMTLDGKAAKKYGIDLNVCRTHLEIIRGQPGLAKKIQKVMSETEFEKRTDPDEMLYGGPFFNDDDKERMRHIHSMAPQDLVGYQPPFNDSRLPEMLFRMRARNWPETLTEAEQQRWQTFRQTRLDVGAYLAELTRLSQMAERTDTELKVLKALEDYARGLEASLA
ncbi:exonuclease I [Candidatus Tenderia electrophaga]|jgi:exodeoxyribonuclease-1|uniref:Exodeoxyribonuclease I n=1 Tax=Candidatus Tenderia electrophaga TaxID=1748243 RepID=A0A0S2T9T1_9GAMM|nr:exonuclease I [Candidatus Tenderia electrophaga]